MFDDSAYELCTVLDVANGNFSEIPVTTSSVSETVIISMHSFSNPVKIFPFQGCCNCLETVVSSEEISIKFLNNSSGLIGLWKY